MAQNILSFRSVTMQCIGVVGLLLTIYAMLSPLLELESWYHARQAYRYPYLMEAFKLAIENGDLYPRWLSDLYGGYGYPTFIFYPPGFWAFAYPFTLLFTDVTIALKAFLLFSFSLSAAGAYLLARLYCSKAAALCCAIYFLTVPNFLVLLYDRGALAELTASLSLPWLLYCLLCLFNGIKNRALHWKWVVGFICAYTFLLYTHPFTSVWMSTLLLGLCIALIVKLPKPLRLYGLATIALCAFMAFILASPHWLTALQLRGEINLIGELNWNGNFQQQHGVLSTLLRLGPLHVFFGMAGWLLYQNKMRWIYIFYVVVLFLLCLHISKPIWQGFAPLSLVQGPFRIYPIITILLYLGICHFAQAIETKYTPPQLRGALAIPIFSLIVCIAVWNLSSVPVKKPMDYSQFKNSMLKKISTRSSMTHGNEFKPKRARTRKLNSRHKYDIPLVSTKHKDLQGTINQSLAGHGSDISFVTSPARIIKKRFITINQFYMKGWKAEVNDKPLPIRPKRPSHVSDSPSAFIKNDGRMAIMLLPNQRYNFHVWYDGPPNWKIRNIIIGLLSILCTCFLWLVYKRIGYIKPHKSTISYTK